MIKPSMPTPANAKIDGYGTAAMESRMRTWLISMNEAKPAAEGFTRHPMANASKELVPLVKLAPVAVFIWLMIALPVVSLPAKRVLLMDKEPAALRVILKNIV